MVQYYYDKYQATAVDTWQMAPWTLASETNFNNWVGYSKSFSYDDKLNTVTLGSKWAATEQVTIGSLSYYLAGSIILKQTAKTSGQANTQITYKAEQSSLSESKKTTTYTRGSIVQTNIVAEDGTYPNNGRHSDGYWYVRKNALATAPTIPGGFTQPIGILKAGETTLISWGPSSDAEGNFSRYELDVAIDGGSWTRIGTPSLNNFAYAIPVAMSIQFRTRAIDTGGVASGYRTSNVYPVEQNTPPTVSIIAPSGNVTLYENDTLNISGTAHDADADQSVTAYYQINSEPRKVLATNLSQTQISLSKQLTFKGGKLYDGDTPITGDLFDGVAHTLKVWAVDSENASSVIVEKSFYVVPNRAPLLSVDAVVPSGIVDVDKFTISGNASDQDANANVTVTHRINASNSVEIYNGAGGAWEFDVSLAQLVVGQNTIIIEVIDNYGAKTSKTIKLNKNEVKTPILQSVARYKIEPPKGNAKGVLLWIQRDKDLDLKVELSMTLQGEQESYTTLTATNTAPVDSLTVEDEFYFEADEAKNNIILKLSTSRADVNIDHKIHLISGVLE